MAKISTLEGLKVIVALKSNIPSIGFVFDEPTAFDMAKAVLVATSRLKDRSAAMQACTVYFTRRDARIDRLPVFEKLSPVFRRTEAKLELRTFIAIRKRLVVIGGVGSRQSRIDAMLGSMFDDALYEFKCESELNTIG